MSTIAVIGSGISGMAAAHLLSSVHHVTLYEKNPVLGGHTRTKIVQHGDKNIPVDTGFIVFNHVNYPELTAMFRYLGVETQKSDMAFGFTMNNGSFEWGAASLNAVFGQRANILKPLFYLLIRDVLKFFKHAPAILATQDNRTLGSLIDSMKLGVEFRDRFILPIGAAIWGCPVDTILDFPARSFVQFFKNHGLLSLTGQHQWHTVKGGSQQYMRKLLEPLNGNIRMNSGVKRVLVEGEKVAVETHNGEINYYDHAILASHADESLAMLNDATAEEKMLLSAFEFQPNHAFLHSDESVMPKRRACWAAWNYNVDEQKNASVTYWMNRLQSIDKNYPLFVTLNPTKPIAPEKIFDEHLFYHPIFTANAIAAQALIPSIQGKRNIWFCGAYQRYGFHEDGLMSAINVAKSLGVSIPWH